MCPDERPAGTSALTPPLLRSANIRRAALFGLLCGALSAAGEEIVIRVEAQIDGERIRYRCGGREIADLDAVEAWLKAQKAKAGNARCRPVLGGTEDAVKRAMKDLDERFWRAGLMPPEVEERLICVYAWKQGPKLVYRCGERDLTDAATVTTWVAEQAKADGAIVGVLLRGDGAWHAQQALFARCAAANLFVRVETEEDRLPYVAPGEAAASGEVFRLEITDEGGLRGPEGEVSLGDWARKLEKAAKGVRLKGLVEHEVVVRVGSRTAWGQLALALGVTANEGYYRVFIEHPKGDTWKRVPFRLPVKQMDLLGVELCVEADRVRLPRDEANVVLPVQIRSADRGILATFGRPRGSLLAGWISGDRPSVPIDSPEFKARVVGLRGIERRRGCEGIAVCIDAPPGLPAQAVLEVVAIFNDDAGLSVMTYSPVLSAGQAELETRKLPVPEAPPGMDEDH